MPPTGWYCANPGPERAVALPVEDATSRKSPAPEPASSAAEPPPPPPPPPPEHATARKINAGIAIDFEIDMLPPSAERVARTSREHVQCRARRAPARFAPCSSRGPPQCVAPRSAGRTAVGASACARCGQLFSAHECAKSRSVALRPVTLRIPPESRGTPRFTLLQRG